ncbi:MAG: hypothetical protein ACTSWY_05350 [Promethearchaeota archaeon]
MKKFPLNIATKKQLEIIKNGLDHVSGTVWSELGKESYNLYSKTGKPATQIFLVRHEDIKLFKILLKEIGTSIEHSGIFFGFFHNREFRLSLEGGEFLFLELNKRRKMDLKTITITEKASKSFLYGNSLTPGDFIKKSDFLNKKDVVFVLNPNRMFIGIGYIFKKPIKEKMSKQKKFNKNIAEIELRNLTDYGYYIRRGF